MTTTTRPDVVLPSLPSVYRTRGSVELKEFFRQRESVVFTLMFPVILLVVFGAVLDYDIGGGVAFTQYFMAGVIAAGILGASLQNMAISIATERSDGTLKSLAGTPMPKSAYFVGKIVQVLAVTVLIIAILLAVGVVAYGVVLPSGSDWFTFLWVAALGLGVLHPARHRRLQPGQERPLRLGDDHPDRPRAAVHLRCLLPVQPDARWMQTIAAFFPLKWMAQGLRSVFLPDFLAAEEPAGSWELGRVAIVLGLWCVAGLLLCVATFRWQDRSAG